MEDLGPAVLAAGFWRRVGGSYPSCELRPPGSRLQPCHDHGLRRSPAAWQAMSFDGAPCKRAGLLGGASLRRRESHPLANDGTSNVRFWHRIKSMSSGGCSRGLPKGDGLRAPRQKHAATWMLGALQDDEAALRYCGTKSVLRSCLLRVEPDHQHGAGAQEIVEPIHCRIECVKRASPPIHERDFILTCRPAAIPCSSRQQISATMQLNHQFHALRADHDDALPRRAVRDGHHRIDDPVADP